MTKEITKLWEIPYRFLFASAWEHREQWHGNQHAHDTFEIAFILEGIYNMVLNGTRQCTLSAGDMLLVPGGTYHVERTPGARLVRKFLIFEMDVPDNARFAPELLDVVHAHEYLEDFRFLYDTIYQEQDCARWGSEERVFMCVRQFLLLFSRCALRSRFAPDSSALSPKQTAIVRAATVDLEATLDRSDQIPEIAGRYSLSPAHFSTIFRRYHGIPPSAYVRRLRVERAQSLLARSALNIQQIAEELGYYDPAHFCRHFRNETGQTPKAYRKQALREGPPDRRLGNLKRSIEQERISPQDRNPED